jgi:inner membrane protein
MTWISHLAVGSGIGYVFNLNLVAISVGSILPDLLEMVYPAHLKHRGVSHSFALHAICLALFWAIAPMRDLWLGVILGHLVCDSLTPQGIPVLSEQGYKLTFFGGRIRTGSIPEFALAGFIFFLSFILIGPLFGSSQPGGTTLERRNWSDLHKKGVIDKREFYEHRFQLL